MVFFNCLRQMQSLEIVRPFYLVSYGDVKFVKPPKKLAFSEIGFKLVNPIKSH